MLDSNKLSKSHWERNLCQYVHHMEPLLNNFRSIDGLRWAVRWALRWALFVRSIDARGWELHLIDPRSSGTQTKYLSHNDSFIHVSEHGELNVVNAMVERMQVDLEVRVEEDEEGKTPLLRAAENGHLPVVQCLWEQGAAKEARGRYSRTPLHWEAHNGHFTVVQCLCEQGAGKGARDNRGGTPLHQAAHHLPVVQYFEGLG